MKRSSKFFVFCLLIAGSTSVVFNSCEGDNNSGQDDPNNSDEVVVTSISLDKPTLTLAIDEDYTLIATVLPENATNKTVTWTSSSDAIATVSDGKVTAITKGTATITAKAGNQTADCVVTISNPVTFGESVEINGVVWATRNVNAPGAFAAKPEDAGMFYQWNRKKAWPATGDVTGWDSSVPAGDIWEKSNDPSPAGWRVPISDEIKKLLDAEKVSNEWTTQNGISGRKFTDKTTGKSIFLPAAGYRYYYGGMPLYDVGLCGGYWSSTQGNSSGAYYLYFASDYLDWGGYYRHYGFSVRSVAD